MTVKQQTAKLKQSFIKVTFINFIFFLDFYSRMEKVSSGMIRRQKNFLNLVNKCYILSSSEVFLFRFCLENKKKKSAFCCNDSSVKKELNCAMCYIDFEAFREEFNDDCLLFVFYLF